MPKVRAGENLPKRTEIADAALRAIGTKGITSLTIAELAKEPGIPPGKRSLRRSP